VPILRKDFIFDPYQVYEARVAGADAILLIVAALEPARLCQLQELARELGMAALIEVHDQVELDVALDCNPLLLGINNRNLKDFSVDLKTTLRLRPLVPDSVCLVAESGIHTPDDVSLLDSVGVDAILVGEALVTAPDVAARVRSLAQFNGMRL
jgi:indole-3-glycerol phosphate synthase